MKITARQLGRIEAACFGLETLTERNDVGKRLVNIIREVVDDVSDDAAKIEHMLSCDYLPGMAPSAFDARIPAIRAYGREVIDGGAGLITAVRLICEHFAMTQKEFAALIGASETSVSLAATGKKTRETLLCKMAEFFGRASASECRGGCPDGATRLDRKGGE